MVSDSVVNYKVFHEASFDVSRYTCTSFIHDTLNPRNNVYPHLTVR